MPVSRYIYKLAIFHSGDFWMVLDALSAGCVSFWTGRFGSGVTLQWIYTLRSVLELMFVCT